MNLEFIKHNRHFLRVAIFLILIVILSIALVNVTLADHRTYHPLVPCGRQGEDPCTQCDFLKLGKNLIDFVLLFIVPVVGTLLITVAGFMILLSGASPALINWGKSIFWSVMVGILIISTSWLVVNFLLKSLAGESDIAKEWYKLTCTATVKTVTGALEKEKEKSQKEAQETAEKKAEKKTETEKEFPPLATLTITTTSLPNAVAGKDYSQTLQAQGGKTPYVWTKLGAFPQELNFSKDGKISGKPAKAGEYTFTVYLEDSSSPKQNFQKQFTIKVLLTAPAVTISGVAVKNITANSATITWTTDKPSTSQVNYGTATSYGSSTTKNAKEVTSHSVGITGLKPNTTYHAQAVSTFGGFTARSGDKEFKTLPDTAGAVCKFSGVDLCKPSSATCPANSCDQYSSAIKKAAASISISGINEEALIRSFMFNESSCNVSARSKSTPPSCGLMQLRPSTANIFKSKCGVKENITCDWLTDSKNAEDSICIASKFIESIAGGLCGSQVRNIAAGYNGGVGACSISRDCKNDKSCDGGAVKRWECLYDNPEKTVCNTGFDETRNYAPKVLACYNTNSR